MRLYDGPGDLKRITPGSYTEAWDTDQHGFLFFAHEA